MRRPPIAMRPVPLCLSLMLVLACLPAAGCGGGGEPDGDTATDGDMSVDGDTEISNEPVVLVVTAAGSDGLAEEFAPAVYTRMPLAGGEPLIVFLDRKDNLDGSRTFTWNDVPPGSYWIVGRQPTEGGEEIGYSPENPVVVTLADGGQRTVSLLLGPPGTIEGRIGFPPVAGRLQPTATLRCDTGDDGYADVLPFNVEGENDGTGAGFSLGGLYRQAACRVAAEGFVFVGPDRYFFRGESADLVFPAGQPDLTGVTVDLVPVEPVPAGSVAGRIALGFEAPAAAVTLGLYRQPPAPGVAPAHSIVQTTAREGFYHFHLGPIVNGGSYWIEASARWTVDGTEHESGLVHPGNPFVLDPASSSGDKDLRFADLTIPETVATGSIGGTVEVLNGPVVVTGQIHLYRTASPEIVPPNDEAISAILYPYDFVAGRAPFLFEYLKDGFYWIQVQINDVSDPVNPRIVHAWYEGNPMLISIDLGLKEIRDLVVSVDMQEETGK